MLKDGLKSSEVISAAVLAIAQFLVAIGSSEHMVVQLAGLLISGGLGGLLLHKRSALKAMELDLRGKDLEAEARKAEAHAKSMAAELGLRELELEE